MTEEQARTKWCPMARHYTLGGPEEAPVTVNRDTRNRPDEYCLCIASDCMMWRFIDTGYCGLAGKP